jgi:hypothetical protein
MYFATASTFDWLTLKAEYPSCQANRPFFIAAVSFNHFDENAFSVCTTLDIVTVGGMDRRMWT